jgi:uncharacterized protein YndB with AHSA1/START domain
MNPINEAGCEIISERMLNTPRDLVFKAWANPEHLKKWFGPNGFTNTFHEFDLRPGGNWKFTMHGPDKKNYENQCIFFSIVPAELISWHHISEPQFQVVATFEALEDNKTKLIFRMIFSSQETCNKLKVLVVPANEENFDRLETELQNMAS